MSKRILVVEDQEDNRQIIRDMLSATDYQITEAENGEEAQRRWHTSGPISF
jgi:two-component system cell cycle response regulator DivK